MKTHSQYWIIYCEANKAAQSMARKPTYEALEKRVKEVEREAVKRKRGEKELVKREER